MNDLHKTWSVSGIVALNCTAILFQPPELFAQAYGGSGQSSSAQQYGPGVYVVDALADQIRGRAEIARSVAEASEHLANARSTNAQAVRQEIANAVERVDGSWERRTIGEAERLKRYITLSQRQRIRDSRIWERLKDHPRLNGPNITSGTALNFLLDRLSGNQLAIRFSYSQTDGPPDPAAFERFELSPDTLNYLYLRQDLPNGRRLVFRANEGTALNVDEWPFLLQADELAPQRTAFEFARRTAVAESERGNISKVALEELKQTLDQLNAAFQKRYRREDRTESITTFGRYLAAKRFLQSLAGEISLLQQHVRHHADAFDGSLRFDGRDLRGLLTHMSRNGLEFAPARSGGEAAYYVVYQMMRDLYLAVADKDDYIIPSEKLMGTASISERIRQSNLWRKRGAARTNGTATDNDVAESDDSAAYPQN